MITEFMTALDYFGTVVFAITGCLVAAKRGSDILAFVLLGFVTAVGGGTIRDVLMGRMPVFWVEGPIYLIICIVTGTMMFMGLQHMKRIKNYEFMLVWADAIGLATFTVIGTHIAISGGVPALPAILLGVSTACFGGLIRDLLSQEETLIFKKDIYMTACIIGAIIYIACYSLRLETLAVIGGFSSTFIIRGLAIHFHLKLPGHGK